MPREYSIRRCLAVVLIGAIAGLLPACRPRQTEQAETEPTVVPGGFELPPQALRLVLEAEKAAEIKAPAEVVADPETGDGHYVRIPVGAGKPPAPPGELRFKLSLHEAAELRFWFRTLWSGSCANSLLLKLPGAPEKIIGEDGTYKHWHWVQGPTVSLPAGDSPILLRQREDDIAIDQLLVTADLQYVPVDVERPAAGTPTP